MSENKTKPTDASVEEFLSRVEHPTRRADGFELVKLMKEITKEEPLMWGPTLVGFGTYHYEYKTGREGDWPKTGFSPRKQSLSVYIMGGFEKYDDLLAKLGKHKIGKGCLYINKLADVNNDVLKEIVKRSYEQFS